MSLALCTTTSVGIVLAADTRLWYQNLKGMARIGSDTGSNLFHINDRIGVALSGMAYLTEDHLPKNMGKFIQEFKNDPEIEDLDVKQTAEKLNQFFNDKYNWDEELDGILDTIKKEIQEAGYKLLDIEKTPPQIIYRFKTSDGVEEEHSVGIDSLEILVSGYNKDGSHAVYGSFIPGDIIKYIDSNDKDINHYGSSWIGHSDVLSRLLLGFDERITALDFIYDLSDEDKDKTIHQLRGLEYNIQWSRMTLQDAIDFCTLMIQTTSAIKHYADGIHADPGSVPDVGSHVDVAVITPDKGFLWINKKKLKFDGKEIELD